MPDTQQSTVGNPRDLQCKAVRLRRRMLEAIVHAGAGHTGGGLSSIDILIVLYNRVLRVSPESMQDPARDRYIQSKGHCVEALYTVLADRGFFPDAQLDTICRYRSEFVGHPTRKIPGVEHNTGALGHGLSVCVGTALGLRIEGLMSTRVFALLGDGELAEGSNWEAAMCAAHYRLDALTAIVDKNSLQITGRTHDVCDIDPLDAKFEAFGWSVVKVDGHDHMALERTLQAPAIAGKPRVIIAQTIKGKGISFMEDVTKWHHGVPSATEFDRALAELEQAAVTLGCDA
jgi:transketolase